MVELVVTNAGIAEVQAALLGSYTITLNRFKRNQKKE